MSEKAGLTRRLRFSRDQEHIAAFYKLMSFAGIALVTLAEGTITELRVGLKGTMSALFLKDLAKKSKRPVIPALL